MYSSKFSDIPGNWVHGILARQFNMNFHFPMHSHEHYELEYILDGEMSTFINGKEVGMKPGDFYILGSNDYHWMRLATHKVTLLSIFFYHPETAPEITALLESNPCPVVGTIPEGDRPLFEHLIHQIYSTDNFSLSEQTDTVSLCANLALHMAYRAKPTPLNEDKVNDSYLQRALHYILAHYNEPLTLDLVAHVVGLSYNYFCSTFSTQVGCSFLDYLNNVRVQKAQTMLVYAPKRSVTDIAFEVGFGSYSNFYRAFLRSTGISPREYREKHITNS